jgi:hypothetical protein
MKQMGASGWWFPPLLYGDMVPNMLAAIPTFFDMKYDFRWYFALIPAFTLGPVALPHLAMRVFTSSSVKSARWAVVWFVLFLGLLFCGTYVAGFAGNYFRATTGNIIEKGRPGPPGAQRLFQSDIVAAFVMAAPGRRPDDHQRQPEAIAGLVATTCGIMAPNMDRKKKMRWAKGPGAGGVAAILLAFKPPAFLVTRSCGPSPAGLHASRAFAGRVWKGPQAALIVSLDHLRAATSSFHPTCSRPSSSARAAAALGMTAGCHRAVELRSVHLLSKLFNAWTPEGLCPDSGRQADHRPDSGWGRGYEESRYQSTLWPLVAVAFCAAILIWACSPGADRTDLNGGGFTPEEASAPLAWRRQ